MRHIPICDKALGKFDGASPAARRVGSGISPVTQAQYPSGTMPTASSVDSHLFTGVNMVESAAADFCGGRAVVLSRRCPGKSGPNEDGAALVPYDATSGLLVVADGAGGQKAGEEASGLAISCIAASVRRAREGGVDLRDAVLDGIEEANRAITGLGVGAGSTLAIIELRDGTVRPFHVGDSMILTTGQRGRVKLQTVAHSPTGYAVEAGLLDADEALRHAERHLVSNILGTPDMRMEVGSTVQLADRDTVLLASDGLSDNLTQEQIIEIVRKGPLDRAAGRLAASCLTHMEGDLAPSKPDDLTFVLFRLAPLRPSRRPSCPPGAAVV